jgi:hypothetical protein
MTRRIRGTPAKSDYVMKRKEIREDLWIRKAGVHVLNAGLKLL